MDNNEEKTVQNDFEQVENDTSENKSVDINEVEEELNEETFTYTIDNNNVNNDYNKVNYNDKKSLIYIVIGILILVLIIGLLVFFANRNKSKNVDYSEIESKMVSAAKKYYEKNNDLLPVLDDSLISVSVDTLIENSFLKPFSELVEDGVSCSGYVSVSKGNTDYVYFPYLNCGEVYESSILSNKIISNGVVNVGEGLYKYSDEYVFRGEYPNNYVKFDDKEWRIIKINSDGSIKLIYTDKKVEKTLWDDRYNSSREGYVGINDFRVSRILDYLKDAYENDVFVSKKNKNLLVKHDWCIGKISQTDAAIANINVCDDVYDDLYIGLVRVDEVLLPSIADNCVNLYDIECTNYNYFFNINVGWTLNTSSDKSYVVFSSNGGAISYKNASVDSNIRPVININSNILYKSGDGTQSNPYVIGD